MLPLLLLLGIAAASPVVWPPPAEEVANRFVRALASGDADQLAAITTDEAVALGDWRDLRHLIETFDCLSIPRHAVHVENVTDAELELLVTVDVTAFARGTGRPLPFPKRWRIVAVRTSGGWKLRSILHEERVIGRRLMALPELDEETFLAAARDVDLERTIIEFLNDPALYLDQAKGIAKARLGGTMARKRGMTIAELISIREEAIVVMFHGDLPRAHEIGEKMVAFADASAIPDAHATAALTMGILDWQNGRFDAALERFATGAALIDDIDDPRGAMKARYMRALLLSNRGRHREVLTSAATLEEEAQRFSWLEGVYLAAILRNETFAQLQDAQASRHFAVECLRLAERLRNEEFISVSLSNLAASERETGNAASAARLVQRILERPETQRADSTVRAVLHGTLAAALAEDERYAEAEAELEIALRMTRQKTEEKLLEADMLRALSQIRLMAGRTDAALRTAEEADALIRHHGARIGLFRKDSAWAIRGALGSALRAAGRPTEAAEALQSSIDLIEAARADLGSDGVALSGFMSDKSQPYRELVSLLVDRGRFHDALVVTERFRARALATAAALGYVDRLPSMSEADSERYDAFHETIADLNRKLLANREDPANDAIREQLNQARIEQRAFLTRVYAARADIRHRNLDDPAAVLADAGRVLPRADEIVLSFSVHDRETFAFCVTREGPELAISVQRIPLKKSELEARIRDFVGQIGRRDLDYRRNARALYDLLLAPFAARIAGKRILFVIPDGMLWRLPFQALQRADGKHLVELVAVAYTPSLTLLRNDRARDDGDRATPALLAIADPVLARHNPAMASATHRSSDLGPLPDAREEVQAIRSTYDERSRVLIGSQATETAVKELAPRFDVLHLATHGILDDAAPMYSALVLAGSSADDGLLEAREMMELDLSADLAILSACESAGGDVTPGEGIIGMSWALMVAGCRNTIVSQWKVESGSTAALMIAFHRQAHGQADYASALQRAQRELMRKDEFSHPYYWSPFVLVATSQ
jgi:CHAT domain-containing protein